MITIAKYKDESSIAGYSANNKSYLTTEKGFYLFGFTTTIKNATLKDLKLTKEYALELVGRFSDIDKQLLELKLLKTDNTLSTSTKVYQVCSGAMINGKIYITSQILNEQNITIMFTYKYRTNSNTFFNTANTFDKKITFSYGVKQSEEKSRYIRRANKQEQIRRKFKER